MPHTPEFRYKARKTSLQGGTIDEIAPIVYTSRPIETEVVVKLQGKTLEKDKDYVVSYRNNVNAGIATVVISGANAYKDSIEKEFAIQKALSKIVLDPQTVKWSSEGNAYTGKVIKGGSSGRVTYAYYSDQGCSTLVSTAGVNAAGTYYAKATLEADDNYESAISGAVEFKVEDVANPFPDVVSGAWYEDGVYRAAGLGVIGGYANGNFGPNDKVTREQLAAMLANYHEKVAGKAVSGSEGDYASMGDRGSVSDWARTAVGWCFKLGILSGSGGQLRPQGNASRAEACKMVVGLHDLLA